MFVNKLPNADEPVIMDTDDVTYCVTNEDAVMAPITFMSPNNVTLCVNGFKNDAVAAYEALVALNARDAVCAIEADTAYDAVPRV